jgi:hypothetical protein
MIIINVDHRRRGPINCLNISAKWDSRFQRALAGIKWGALFGLTVLIVKTALGSLLK